MNRLWNYPLHQKGQFHDLRLSYLCLWFQTLVKEDVISPLSTLIVSLKQLDDVLHKYRFRLSLTQFLQVNHLLTWSCHQFSLSPVALVISLSYHQFVMLSIRPVISLSLKSLISEIRQYRISFQGQVRQLVLAEEGKSINVLARWTCDCLQVHVIVYKYMRLFTSNQLQN